MQSILLVDDEATLLALMGRYLGRLGFAVEPASAAGQALEIFGRSPESFSLAVLDLHLPDMPGTELARRLCAAGKPDLKILFCTGDLFDSENLPGELRGRTAVLQKPFLPRDLAAEVERMLGLGTERAEAAGAKFTG